MDLSPNTLDGICTSATRRSQIAPKELHDLMVTVSDQAGSSAAPTETSVGTSGHHPLRHGFSNDSFELVLTLRVSEISLKHLTKHALSLTIMSPRRRA